MLSINPTNYNKEDVLPGFFNSIFSNGFNDSELIFIDDCSTDSSVKIAEKFPCRIVRNKQNLGPAVSRNLASKFAKDTALVFTDTDIEDHELAAKMLEHHQVFYDEELTFFHYYTSTRLVLKKMFIRSKMFARSTSIKVYKEKLRISLHRNASFVLSAAITALAITIPLSLLFSSTIFCIAAFIFSVAILAKIIHHRLLLATVIKNENLLFAVYCFLFIYLTPLFAMEGIGK